MIKDDEELRDDKNKDSLSSMYEGTIKEFKEGEILKGRIVEIMPKEVLVDIGYKSEGVISINEFDHPEQLKVGDEIEVLLESKENEEGMIVLSKKKAERLQGWTRIISQYKEGDLIEGRVVKKIRGGYMVNIGMDAFLPASLATAKGYGNLTQVFDKTLEFKIIKINKSRKNVVVSRKDAIQERFQREREKILSELIKGQIVTGTVKNITDFGAFIDLGGIDGLLHITDMSWGRINHPSQILKLGDKIEVMILDIDKSSGKVSLGLKQKQPNPWLDVEVRYPVGSKVKGRVTNLLAYGAFVELEKGIEGLVHISEMSWRKKINHSSELLKVGDEVEVVVLDIDKENQRVSLGIKQLERDPWTQISTKYKVGDRIKGVVRNLTDYGAFVELEEGIDGLIHISDMSWTRKVNNPREILKKGQGVEAVILNVDQANRRIALGLKQLTPDPWPDIAKHYMTGTVVEGKITKVANFGVFVEIEKDLEGLIHISELRQESSAPLDQLYKVGDTIKVRILKVNTEQKKIALTNRDV